MKHAPQHILHSPRITEKASALEARGCYVFNVHKEANKKEIAQTVRAMYKVTPRLVRVVNAKGAKKAYVFLKKGDVLERA